MTRKQARKRQYKNIGDLNHIKISNNLKLSIRIPASYSSKQK